MSMTDILATIERVVFGMSAEEAVSKRLALIDERTGQVLKRMADALDDADDNDDDEQ